jgi:hypothetical protein
MTESTQENKRNPPSHLTKAQTHSLMHLTLHSVSKRRVKSSEVENGLRAKCVRNAPGKDADSCIKLGEAQESNAVSI